MEFLNLISISTPGAPAPLATGLIYALTESTIEGKVILAVLFLGSIFSWSVMVTKLRHLRFAQEQSGRFASLFRRDRQPLRLYEQEVAFEGSPLYEIYQAGCDELCFQMLGSTEVDETFRARVAESPKISSAQMRAVIAAMERAVGESALKLESHMNILSMAVSGAPFIGLLGTVWGVMDAFSGIAIAGNANLSAMAPGVSGALVTTVVGLLVAIPAMFGYNFLVTSVRSMIVQSDNFAAELASAIEHRFVRYSSREED